MKTIKILVFLLLTSGFSIAQQSNFFEKLNLDQLPEVKNSLQKSESAALKTLLSVYREKENLYTRVSKSESKEIQSLFPDDVKNSIKVANQVVNKYFLYRYPWDMEKTNVPHQFKGEIDWTFTENKDPEWHWMLNRHRYWVDLGKAYFFTGKEKYAKTFVNQVSHWIDNNPINKKMKWFSWRRIEAGIRCENWIKTFELVKNSKHVTPAFLKKFLNSLFEHAEFLNTNFSNFSKTSNWGVLEHQGLFNVALFMDDFKNSNHWLSEAIRKLNICSGLQVLDDGVHWEQSPMYHNEVFHCFMNVTMLAKRKNIAIPSQIPENAEKMAIANVKWQKPNYNQPLIGDSDDTDLRGILTLSSVLFNNPIIKSRAYQKLDYETYFILGKNQAAQYESMPSKLPPYLSVHQQPSGDVYMRNSWNEDATYTSIHFKKTGGGHGHDDILHFSIFANNRDYLVDGGRYTYVGSPLREYFKSSFSHNSLAVDGLPNSIYEGSWSNKFEASSQAIYSKLEKDYDFAEGVNLAYLRLEDPVLMRRRMLYLKPNVWFVVDYFKANKEHEYSQYFNFPNEQVAIKNGGIETTYQDKNLRIQPINKGEIQIKDTWYSPEYNLKVPSKTAVVSTKKNGSSSFISLLYFPEETSITFEKVTIYNRVKRKMKDEEAEAIRFKLDGAEYTLFVSHQFPSPSVTFYEIDDVIIRGEVVLIKKEKGNTTIEIIKE